jgi:hypothetical protein
MSILEQDANELPQRLPQAAPEVRAPELVQHHIGKKNLEAAQKLRTQLSQGEEYPTEKLRNCAGLRRGSLPRPTIFTQALNNFQLHGSGRGQGRGLRK